MFGYVKVYQPELKMGEFEHYRGVYCALCRTLGKRYGLFAQWSLSYDFTFWALLRLSMAAECAGFRKARCPYNPFKKRTCCCDTAQLEAAADAAVLLTYHKLRDTIADSGFVKGLGARLLLPMAARDRRRCARRHPDWDAAVAACMQRQGELEKAQCPSLDEAAEPTAQLLEFLFTMDTRDERQKRVLARLGYCLGRWIYVMDAVDDLEEDLRHGCYNPLALSAGLAEWDEERVRAVREKARLSLNACLAECKAAYELLEIRRFDGILRNVLEWGMPSVQQKERKRDEKPL